MTTPTASTGLDPKRVYWYWRRVLLDPNTPPEQSLSAAGTLRLLQEWYPHLAKSRPPEGFEDLKGPWDFLLTPGIRLPGYGGASLKVGEPVAWKPGTYGWAYCPEVQNRYVGVMGVTGDRLCVIVEDDPRFPMQPTTDPECQLWVPAVGVHQPPGGPGHYAYIGSSHFEYPQTVAEAAVVKSSNLGGYNPGYPGGYGGNRY